MASTATTSPSNEQDAHRQLLAHAIDHATHLLRINNIIAMAVNGPPSAVAIAIGEEMYERISSALEDMIVTEDEENVHITEVSEDEDSGTVIEENEVDDYSDDDLCSSTKKMEGISWDIKKKTVAVANSNPKWSWKTIQKRVCKQLKSSSQLAKWKRLVGQDGSARDKYCAISEWTYGMFSEARAVKQQVTTRMLRQWALQAANQFWANNTNFTASRTWVISFKRQHRIRQRKVTRFVSKADVTSFDDILNSARIFQQQTRQIVPLFDPDYVINTDQTGCEYKIHPKRTLSFQGEKVTQVATTSLNKMTHSYTAQYAITLSGKLLPKVFLCLQESHGVFGVRVIQDVRRQESELGNVYVTCTKSGKLQTDTYQKFLLEIVKPYVLTNKLLFIVDSWSGQQNRVMYDELFLDPAEQNAPTCTLKTIPPKCTPLCQPCDIYFFRQVKNLVSRFQNANTLIAENREISDRENIIKLHSIIHNQLSSPVFKKMIQYAWYASQLTLPAYEKPTFRNVNEVCFPSYLAVKKCICTAQVFIACSWCRINFCFQCFYDNCHGNNCRDLALQEEEL